METVSKYQQQALDWASKHGVTLRCKWLGHLRHFIDDTDTRDVYECTLTRGAVAPVRTMTTRFGQSLKDSKRCEQSDGPYWAREARDRERAGRPMKQLNTRRVEPTMYDLVACLTKSEPGSFEEFCGDFGGNTDSIKDRDNYLAVQKEWRDFCRLCGDDEAMIAEAQEIA